jgi:dTDP-4-amino-4,6-dideoxygalactose transaminase
LDSEIVYTALNIPNMIMIARERGVQPIPADLDLTTLAPQLDRLERAITPKTRAILVAHLYGAFVPLEPIMALARKYGLMLIEDAAQVYEGRYRGHPEADVSLFSFGPLKTATALASALMRVRDPDLHARLRAHHERWPLQSRWDYCKRLCKYGALKFFGSKWIYAAARKAARLVFGDVDRFIHDSAKSFRASEIMTRLRQRPSAPLLALLERRLSRFDHQRLAERAENGRLLKDRLSGHFFCPGAEVEAHSYWLFPVMVAEPRRAIAELAAAGFDAATADSMTAVPAPAERPELDPANVRAALAKIILLPCYPGIPRPELVRMADVLIRSEAAASKVVSWQRNEQLEPNAENAARR